MALLGRKKDDAAETKSSGRLLSKADLLKKWDLEIEKVEFDDGDFVYVREMTGRERDTFERSIMEETRDRKGNVTYKGNIQDFRAKLCVHAICDAEGKLLLSPGDFEALSTSMPVAKLELIVNAAQRLSGISPEDREALTGNLEADKVGSSSSDSAEN